MHEVLGGGRKARVVAHEVPRGGRKAKGVARSVPGVAREAGSLARGGSRLARRAADLVRQLDGAPFEPARYRWVPVLTSIDAAGSHSNPARDSYQSY